MEFTELIQKFGKSVGLTAWSPEENGAYRFEVDDMEISIQEIPQGHLVVILAEAGGIPPENVAEFYRMLLEAVSPLDKPDGVVFSIPRESDRILMHQVLSLECLEMESLTKAVEDFVNTLESWKKAISDYRGVASMADAKRHEMESEESRFSSAEMMGSGPVIRL